MAATQQLPQSASQYRRRYQQLVLGLLLAARQAWRRLDRDGSWEDQYATDVGPRLLALLLAAQTTLTREADSYTAAVLNELAFGPATTAGIVPASAFLGLAGDGRDADTLLGTAIGRARAVVAVQQQVVFDELDPPGSLITRPEVRLDLPETPAMRQQGLDEAEQFMAQVMATVLADTARAAESAAIAARPWVAGWVRMLNPPSCSRCVILAGRFYRWNDGFDRHPGCDCVHIPVSEADAGDLRLSPDTYFESLTAAEQDATFTKAGAQAVRDGADLGQVVNARRGMQTAQIGGRATLISLEGTTRRGVASRARTGRNLSARIMPETIYRVARDRDDAVRLLRLNGFIL